MQIVRLIDIHSVFVLFKLTGDTAALARSGEAGWFGTESRSAEALICPSWVKNAVPVCDLHSSIWLPNSQFHIDNYIH